MSVTIKDARVVDEFCNFMLRELASRKTRLSQELTKFANQSRFKDYSPLQRKLLKLRELYSRDKPFFEATVAQLNHSEHKGTSSPINFIQIAERMLPQLHYRGELTGGNFKDL